MTIKINIEPNKNPEIERYENDLKVGARKVSTMELQKLFAKELAIDELLSVLIHDRIDEFSLLLEQTTSVSKDADEFLSTIFQYIDTRLVDTTNSTGISIKSLLKHCHINANEFDPESFNELMVDWFNRLSQSQIDCSKPINEIIQFLKYEDMPVGTIFDILSTWTKRFKYAASKNELSKDEIGIFIALIQALNTDKNVELKQSLINLTVQSVKNAESDDIRSWLLSGLSSVGIEDLEAELVRREKTPGKKEVRFFTRLPRNASFMASTNKGNVFYYDLPKTGYYTKFHSTMFKEKVGFPRLVFCITVDENYEAVEVKLAAVKGEQPLSTSTKLYRYPYSNVYSDGRLCFTYNGIPCDEVPEAFLSTPNNNHLNSGGFEIFKKYEGIEFDDDTLKPLDVTLGEFY